ncbi:CRISPR-associated protein Cas10/Csm1, subtype III-A/MTUBE [Cyclonatronum proteinivorum]|uniref:CRISPR system single-strand-specific deoxyribonuclease Cas10/Csm1 (subtype III-A) n=1 Tax=Cyclonatronum proteinivorum TaxID=1457365 RepID=A0A345UPN5_9BACT|nr:type III-A CRISPR-associated protein Cas10/Csm1 [Cyclonatronum proteinivorum]AXJ02437.1 CRISPR-associated protein Cas10/Csm1, subtype III-A/MTUBE [Cyclonatronum proteinivorum]
MLQLNAKQGIYLAALLHDIGKFWQRASRSRKVLPLEVQQVEGDICPKGKAGYATHIHALFTYAFFLNHRAIIPESFEIEGETVGIARLSARHHRKDLNGWERIIMFADHLSSGHDRRDDEEADDASVAGTSSYKYKKIPLLNVFDTVYRVRKPEERSYFPLRALSTDKVSFPARKHPLDTDLEPEYAKLWDAFEREFVMLPTESTNAFLRSLDHLLRKYTWSIPSATNSMSDVSLYDHAKTTAVIAACLFDSRLARVLPDSMDKLKAETNSRFTLLAGDFSGIQKFIYQISSKGAAKTLKGRSFYIGLVQDVIIEKILKLYGLQPAHILMKSGGRFQMLLPYDPEKLDEAIAFVGEANLELRRIFDGVLYLATGAVDFISDEFFVDGRYSDLVSEAYAKIEEDKSRRYARVIDHDFFKPQKVKGTSAEHICHVTGVDLDKSEVRELGEGADALKVSRAVKEQIELGRALKGAKYLIKTTGGKGLKPLGSFLKKDYPGDVIAYEVVSDLSQAKIKELSDANARVLEIQRFNSTDFLTHAADFGDVSQGFQFYGAAWIPENTAQDQPVEFTDIAKDGQNDLMAIVRMDVDNLGVMFRDGFAPKDDNAGKHRGSISRYSTLSSMLDWFFSAYMNTLFAEHYSNREALDTDLSVAQLRNDKPNNHILPVYAGGDDVFLITRWDLAHQTARVIYDDFKAFTNQHERLTISGGMHVVHGKYPIHKAAQNAEHDEKEAKKLPDASGKAGKDAFCMYGVPLDWKDLTLTEDLMHYLIQQQEEMKSRALLGFIRRLSADYHPNYHYGRWRWRTAYQLQRIGKSYKKEAEMADLASWLFVGSMNDRRPTRFKGLSIKPEIIHLVPLLTRWMQNLTRTTTK